MNETSWNIGRRSQESEKMRMIYLETGGIPLGQTFTNGIRSIIRDPWLMIVQYMPGLLGFKLRQIYYSRRLGYMGKGVIIDPGAYLPFPENIYLDNFCYLGRPAQIYCPEGYVKIGKRCHINSWILGHGGVEIGNYVGTHGSILSVTDSHTGGFRMSGPMVPPQQRNLKYGKVIIEEDAFIGQYSIIMPGVRICEGAVVGPYTLVIHDVPQWTVVMGCPAREIGKRKKVRFQAP